MAAGWVAAAAAGPAVAQVGAEKSAGEMARLARQVAAPKAAAR